MEGSLPVKRVRLEEDKFRSIADWYPMAILALTRLKDAKADPRWIARKLQITVEQASSALSRLERLGLVETSPKFRQVSPPFEVSSEVPSGAIRQYHTQGLQKAMEKLETTPVEKREFQSVILKLQKADLKILKKMIDRFVDQASNAVGESNGQDLYGLNIQLFPISNLEDSK